MQSFRLKLIQALGLVILLSTAAFGQTLNRTASGQPEIYFVPDVTAQFNQIALRPDALLVEMASPIPISPSIFRVLSGNMAPACSCRLTATTRIALFVIMNPDTFFW